MMALEKRASSALPAQSKVIVFGALDRLGQLVVRHMVKDGTYKPNAFIRSPPNLATLARGEAVTIIGTAYAGSDPVENVEITFDDGDSWQPCSFDYAPGANIWTIWRFEWVPTSRGRQRIRTRVTTAGGQVTADDPAGTDRLAGYDSGMEVELWVS